jgi:hypothetical protein
MEKSNPFSALSMVMGIGDIMTDSKKESNAWKLRMLKASMGRGLHMPDNWDSLSEDEKEKRLNKIIELNRRPL